MRTSSLGSFSLVAAQNFERVISSIRKNGEIDWAEVRNQFDIIHWDKLHFNSGSAGVMPKPVLDYTMDLMKSMNSMAPYEAWSGWSGIRRDILKRISSMVSVTPEELTLVRNTTEALNIIISGLELKKGDQIIAANHDYPYALNAVQNRAKRENLELVYVDTILPRDSQELVKAYTEKISPRTRVILATHISHREGHIFPVRELSEAISGSDIRIVVDGAHSFAHIPVDLTAMGCHYYASSLHKWLNAPHGNGLLYIKKEYQRELAGLFSSPVDHSGDISKYEHLGTRGFYQEIGISAALDFHERIGMQNKYNRLMELKNYWTGELRRNGKIRFHTNLDNQYSGAIASVSVEGKPAGAVLKSLNEDYNIHAKTVGSSWGSAVRITPNLFTDFSDLDKLIEAIERIAS